MYINIPLDKFDTSNITFDTKQKNTIIDNSDFYMIHYINDFCSLHNIFITVPVNDCVLSKKYNKYMCKFDDVCIIYKLKLIEDRIIMMFMNYLFINKFYISSKQKSITQISSFNNNENNISSKINNIILDDKQHDDNIQKNILHPSKLIQIDDETKYKLHMSTMHKYKYVTNMYNHIKCGEIKTKHITGNSSKEFNNNKTYNIERMNVILKISGVWVKNNEVGIIYKFILELP